MQFVYEILFINNSCEVPHASDAAFKVVVCVLSIKVLLILCSNKCIGILRCGNIKV